MSWGWELLDLRKADPPMERITIITDDENAPKAVCRIENTESKQPLGLDDENAARLINQAPYLLHRLEVLVSMAELCDDANEPSSDLYIEIYLAKEAIRKASAATTEHTGEK